MIDKERIKKEIDQMPDELVEKVYAFIAQLQKEKKHKKTIHSYTLGGAFDNTHIRTQAYE